MSPGLLKEFRGEIHVSLWTSGESLVGNDSSPILEFVSIILMFGEALAASPSGGRDKALQPDGRSIGQGGQTGSVHSMRFPFASQIRPL